MRSGTGRILRPVELPAGPEIRDKAHCTSMVLAAKVTEKTSEMSYGFASNLRAALPNASFIGFTGTPIEKTDWEMSNDEFGMSN